MEENKENNGCAKMFLYLCAGILIIMVIGGAMEGIGKVLLGLPWYADIILSIGFVFLIGKLFR